MKKKLLAILSLSFVLLTFLVLPISALTNVDYQTSTQRQDDRRINAPSSIVFTDFTRQHSAIVDVPNRVNVYETQIGTSTSGRRFEYRWGGILTSSTYSDDITIPSRTSDVHGYSQFIVNGATTDSSFYSTPSTLYPLGQLHTFDGLSQSTTVDSVSLLRNGYAFTFDLLELTFNDYYYDPKVITSPTGLNLQWYIYVPTVSTTIEGAIQDIIDKNVLNIAMNGYVSRYTEEEGTPIFTPVEIPCEYLSHTLTTVPGNPSLTILCVNTTYSYEEHINSRLREFELVSAVHHTERIPYVNLSLDLPPANIGGVAGQGMNPYFVCSLSTYVGDDPYYSSISSFRTIRIDNDTSGILSWLTSTVGGFFNVEFFGFFSLGDLLGIVIAVGVVMLILKIFAGG